MIDPSAGQSPSKRSRPSALALTTVSVLLSWQFGCRPAEEPEAATVASEAGAAESSADDRSIEAQRFDAPPRAEIAGLRGFRTLSRVEFPIEGVEAHELIARYQFPERALVELGLPGREHLENGCEYRLGTAIHTRPAYESASQRLNGQDHRALARRFELRKAAYIWPDGFAWDGEPVADGLLHAPLVDVDGTPLGSLRAELDAQARPRVLATLDPDGTQTDRFEFDAWSQTGQRWHPSRTRLFVGGGLAFTEILEEIEFGSRYLDSQFLPIDALVNQPGFLSTEVGSAFVAEATLEGFDSQKGSSEPATAILSSALEDLADEPAAGNFMVGFFLDPSGRLLSIRKVWAGADAPPPSFQQQPSSRILTARCPEFEQVPKTLERLQGLLPTGARAGRAYWMLDGPSADSPGAVALSFSIDEPSDSAARQVSTGAER